MSMTSTLILQGLALLVAVPMIVISCSTRSRGSAKWKWVLVASVTSWLGVVLYYLLHPRTQRAA